MNPRHAQQTVSADPVQRAARDTTCICKCAALALDFVLILRLESQPLNAASTNRAKFVATALEVAASGRYAPHTAKLQQTQIAATE